MVRKLATPKKTRIRRPPGWSSPREHYIYSDPPGISIEELAKKWRGIKGCKLFYLQKRCTEEGWVQKRRDHWETVDRKVAAKVEQDDVERRERMLKEATDRHTKIGQQTQTAAMFAVGKAVEILQGVGEGKVELADGIKAMNKLIPLVSKGVEIERKGLGLADKFVVASHTKEITLRVIQVLDKWISDSALYDNITRDLMAIEKDSRVEIEDLLQMEVK